MGLFSNYIVDNVQTQIESRAPKMGALPAGPGLEMLNKIFKTGGGNIHFWKSDLSYKDNAPAEEMGKVLGISGATDNTLTDLPSFDDKNRKMTIAELRDVIHGLAKVGALKP